MRFLSLFVVLVTATAFAAGCSGEMSSVYTPRKPKIRKEAGASTINDDRDVGEDDDPTDPTPVRPSDPSPVFPMDAGIVNPPVVATTAFTGAAAFASRTGSSARQNAHTNQLGNANPARRDCLGCHNGNGGPRFTLGGTVFTTAQGTQGAAGVEVRLSSANGTALSVYTDGDGNFYSAAGFTMPALAGVRNATKTHVMSTQASGACNGCHNGNTQPYLSVQ